MMRMKKIKGIIFIFIILVLFGNVVYSYTDIEYTQQEQEYIEKHKEIYVAGNANLEPIESYNGDSYEGILPEIFQKLAGVSGIKFIYINKNESWKNFAKNNQVEIVSGILDKDLEEYNLREKIELIKYPIEDEEKIISIAFTEIADEELIAIIKKSIQKIDEFDKQGIIISNILGYRQDVKQEYILIGAVIILTACTAIFFILYRKYKKESMEAKYVDNITKMGNYKELEKKFYASINDDVRCAYCVVNMGIDISHIEQVYGYSEVEKILKDIADVLNKYVEPNEMFARIYKDTFIIIADFVSDKTITERINIIVNEIKEYENSKTTAYELNIVTGVYFLKQTDDNLQQAVYNAMQARNEAKIQGVSVKICTDALMMKIKKENRQEKSIITALNNNEFIAYAQPLLDLKNEKVREVEILARWESPKLGLIKPNSFLNILENNNVIDKLDFQMYEKTCEMLANLRKENKELFTAFCNFSRKAIEKKGFYEELKKITEKYEIPEQYIGIIITKSSMDKGITNMQLTIEKIKDSGFTVLLDDFDSLSYSFRDIKELPIDYIKISSRLTDNLNDSRTVAILKGIIETVHGLGIKVICEDFKTKENEKILREIGCDRVQGNAYYQPIPTEELVEGQSLKLQN